MSKGFKANSEGCPVLGNAIGEIAGQRAVLSSRDALVRFMDDLEGEPFILNVIWDKTLSKTEEA